MCKCFTNILILFPIEKRRCVAIIPELKLFKDLIENMTRKFIKVPEFPEF